MDLISKLESGVDRLARLAYFRAQAERVARKRFIENRDENLFFGRHQTWDEACAAAAAFGTTGYDNEASASLYDFRTRIDTYDYPALYWLMRSRSEGHRSVGDLGGSIGIKFVAFRDVISSWPDLTWTVHDVPAAIARGRALAAARGNGEALRFADHFDDLQGIDVLYASGVLQYLPKPLGELLKNWANLPKRIIINTAPIHPTEAFFTVNSLGTAFAPYRVQTQADLVRGLNPLGYRLRETWINPDKLMTIPFHDALSLRHYSGYCLDRITS